MRISFRVQEGHDHVTWTIDCPLEIESQQRLDADRIKELFDEMAQGVLAEFRKEYDTLEQQSETTVEIVARRLKTGGDV